MIVFVSLSTGCLLELLTLFVIVAIHELGHFACAKYFGWEVTEIQILPFGGVLHTNHSKQIPLREEIIVTLCGPIQHVWMIAVMVICQNFGIIDIAWYEYMMEANIYIALINLIPILPLDGGRIVQSIMSYRFPYYQVLYWSLLSSVVLSILMLGYVAWQTIYALLPFNVCMLGLFLLTSNITVFKQIPFIFLRFIVNRAKCDVDYELFYARIQSIPAREHQKIHDVLKMFRKEKFHLIIIIQQSGKQIELFDEKKLIKHYLTYKRGGSFISDLLILK
jgi:stage IV sporulation protein FB